MAEIHAEDDLLEMLPGVLFRQAALCDQVFKQLSPLYIFQNEIPRHRNNLSVSLRIKGVCVILTSWTSQARR